MGKALSLAAAQTIPVRGDVDANIERHLRLAGAAAEEHARVVLFPELSLTGYELDLAGQLAFSRDDPRLSPLVEMAASRSMTLVVGAPVRIDARLHIGAFILSSDRAIGVYTKRHLGAFPGSANPGGIVPPAEASVFHPGDLNPLVPAGDREAAVAICADTGRPSHPRTAAELGATIYLASMFAIPSDIESDHRNLETYASRHSMTVLLANFGGPTGGLPSAGRSAIWSDEGEMLCQLDASGAGLAVAVETGGGWRAKAIMLPGS